MSSTDQNPQPAAWPAGVHTRFRTIGGALVDVRGSDSRASYLCLGCDESVGDYADRRTKQLANEHATTCRALPRPTA